ncbi:MAG: hypothetical protein AAF170_11760 [Bacteroidota bacterium]
MRLRRDPGSPINNPTPDQIEDAIRGVNQFDGGFATLSNGDLFVQTAGGAARGYVLEYGGGADAPHLQATGVQQAPVIDAFQRFAAGDSSRDPSLQWEPIETGPAAPLLSGGDQLPEGFHLIAARLRHGDRPLDIRNSIIRDEGLSKLAAAKKVEAVLKVIKAAKAAFGGGLLAFGALVISLILGISNVAAYAVLGLAAAGQLGFAWFVFREYRQPTGSA